MIPCSTLSFSTIKNVSKKLAFVPLKIKSLVTENHSPSPYTHTNILEILWKWLHRNPYILHDIWRIKEIVKIWLYIQIPFCLIWIYELLCYCTVNTHTHICTYASSYFNLNVCLIPIIVNRIVILLHIIRYLLPCIFWKFSIYFHILCYLEAR